MPALQLFGAGREKRIYAVPPYTEVRSLDFEDHPFEPSPRRCRLRALRQPRELPRRGGDRRCRAGGCSSAPTPITATRARRRGRRRNERRPLLEAARPDAALSARVPALDDVALSILAGRGASPSSANRARARPRCCACCPACCGRTPATVRYRDPAGATASTCTAWPRPALRRLHRTDWGFVHQNPRDGLRMRRLRRRQYRRAADGDRRAALRQRSAPRRVEWLQAGRDRPGRHRRPAAHLLRRHAAAAADRPHPGDASAAGLHGRADRRPRRLGAGAAARPDPGAGRRPRPRRACW